MPHLAKEGAQDNVVIAARAKVSPSKQSVAGWSLAMDTEISQKIR